MRTKPDKLAVTVATIDADALRGTLAKGEFVQFRVTKDEKRSIKEIADSLDLSTSEYLLKLHALVAAKFRKDSREG